MTNPTQKTTITRYVNIVAAVDRSYWGYNSDELAKIDPMCVAAGFRFLPPTAAQRPSEDKVPEIDPILEFPWGPVLGSRHLVAPMGMGITAMEVTAERWSADSSLVFPSLDPLAVPAWDGEIEVKVPTRGELQLTISSGSIQAPNMTSLSQCDTTPRVTYHTPFHFSTNIPVQPHYPKANVSDDAAATWDMNTACGAKASQIDGQSLHILEGTNSHDKENDAQYVVWDGAGLSNTTGLGQDLLPLTFLHSTGTPKRTVCRPVSSTRRAQPAFPRWHTSHLSAFPMKRTSRQLLLAISIQIGCPLVRKHPRD